MLYVELSHFQWTFAELGSASRQNDAHGDMPQDNAPVGLSTHFPRPYCSRHIPAIGADGKRLEDSLPCAIILYTLGRCTENMNIGQFDRF